MSKIGRAPITIPAGVTVTLDSSLLTVKGPQGELSHTLPTGIKAELQDSTLTLTRAKETKELRALHGLTRALVANMVNGVNEGFKKSLELIGTGYRAKLAGTKLVLSLGFSHDVEYTPPQGITLNVEGTNFIHVSGSDKQAVGQVAAIIRDYKKPEPYKGKGIRYQGEVVRRKAGKASKAGA